MKTYTTISQINTYKKLSQIKCDICGITTNNEWNESKYDNNDVTIELQQGSSYPEGNGHNTIISFDICPNCFKNHLVKWFKEKYNAEPSIKEVTF